MRILSAGLLSAQRAASGTPSITLTVGANNYASRLKGLRHLEQPYGGLATILLDNSDKGITADLRGNQVIIGYGFSGQGASSAAPLWVLTQRGVSREGDILTQLTCIDIWQKLSLLRVIGGGGVELKGTITGSFQPGMRVTGQTSGATATVLGSGDGYIWVGKVAKGPFSVGETAQANLFSSSQIVVSNVTDIAGGGAPAWDGDKTILEIIRQLTLGVATVTLDSSDGIVDVKKPTYATQTNARVLDIVQDMINYTKCGIRAENDGELHIFDIASAPGSPDYSYDTDHCFISDVRDTSLILPNKIIVVNAEQVGTGITPYYGEAEDAAAIARFMEIPQIILADIQSDSDGTSLAGARISRIQKEATRGTIEVPMNCGQELFDYIRVTDTRAAIDYYGWIGSLEHIWEEGVYRLNIGLGGLVGAAGLPADTEYPLPNLPESVLPAPPGLEGAPPVGAYIAEVVFTPTAYNAVSWASGSVQLADGRTQSINAGNLTLTGVHYIYFIYGNSTLQNSVSYSDAIGEDRGLVAVAAIASTADQKAFVMNPHTKSILINRDQVADYIVNELKIANAAISNAKLQNSCVTANKIMANQVTANHIIAGAIYALHISAGSIEATKLAAQIILATTIWAGNNKVKLSPTGVDIYGSGSLKFDYGANWGTIYLSASYLDIMSPVRILLNASQGTVVAVELTPAFTSGIDCGTSAKKWKNVWAVTVHQGDSVFSNGWALSESKDSKGIVLKRPDGSIAEEWR